MNQQTSNNPKSFYFCTIMGLVGLIVFLTFPRTISKTSADVVLTVATTTLESANIPPNYFDQVPIRAKSAYVYDINTHKVLYSKNSGSSLPLASLTKIMTAITASEMSATSTVVTIDKDALDQDGDNGLLLDEQWSLSSLLKYSLVVSSNDGAYAIAEALGGNASTTLAKDRVVAFVDDMNIKASSLGLTNTRFFNPTGLDIATTTAGSYGSAHDVAQMLMYGVANHNDLFSSTKYPTIVSVSLNGISHTGKNTNILTNQIPNLVASKTGNTDLAGGNLAVIFDPNENHRIVIVVLGSTYEDRFSDVKKLVDATIATISN